MSEKQAEEDRPQARSVRRGLIFAAAVLLVTLLVLTFAVLATRLYEYSREQSAHLIHADSVTDFEIFSVHYDNAAGEITVRAEDGGKVIAPGTSVNYSVRLKDGGSAAVDYTMEARVESLTENALPLRVRVISPDEQYLVGDAKTWGTLDDLADMVHTGTLKRGESVEYLFQWQWPFDGDDAYDTLLGSGEADIAALRISLSVNTVKSSQGTLGCLGTHDPAEIVCFFTLLLAAVILIILSFKPGKRKGNSDDPSDDRSDSEGANGSSHPSDGHEGGSHP